LFAANFPAGRLELDVWSRIPRRSTPIVVYDNGEGLAETAARTLQQLGYTDVALLQDGLPGWRRAGGEVFKDVNVPSKAFGELVESQRHTPSLSAQEVKALLDQQADVVVLDARRFDEYQTMCIPSGISVPGAELVLRAQSLAPSPSTRIIVNCAGRTRSIIGAQSLVNAGIPNPVSALRWSRAPVAVLLILQSGSVHRRRRWPARSPIALVSGVPSGWIWRILLPRPLVPPICLTCARLKNLWRVTCRVFAVRPAASWSRRPMCRPRCGVPVWYWLILTVCAPT
jgi:rhodanese-related sulfurtransferase